MNTAWSYKTRKCAVGKQNGLNPSVLTWKRAPKFAQEREDNLLYWPPGLVRFRPRKLWIHYQTENWMNFERRPVLVSEEVQTDFSAKHCSAVEKEILNFAFILFLERFEWFKQNVWKFYSEIIQKPNNWISWNFAIVFAYVCIGYWFK